MNVVFANLIAAAPPVVLAAVLARWLRGGRGRVAAVWLGFAVACLLWASVVVPLPSGNPIGTRDEWLRRLSGVALLPVGIGVAAMMLYGRQRRVVGDDARRGFGVVPPASERQDDRQRDA